MIKENQSRRTSVRQATSCQALIRLENRRTFPVYIKDFCTGGLLLVQTNQPSGMFDQHCEVGQHFEVLLRERTLPELSVRVKCLRIEKHALGVQFLSYEHALLTALSNFDAKKFEATASSFPKINAEKIQDIANITSGLSGLRSRVVASLDAALNQFFKEIIEIKHDPEVWTNIRGAFEVNDTLDFLSQNSRIFISRFLEETNQFFSIYQKNFFEKKTETVVTNTKVTPRKLSLVDKDDFEEWLSAKLVANKADAEIKNANQQFLIRLSFLVERTVDASLVPFSPTFLCDRLRDQILTSTAKPPRNLVNKIYKLFYKCVLKQLLALIEKLNQYLSESGCLPGDEVYKHLPAKVISTGEKGPVKSGEGRRVVRENSAESSEHQVVDRAVNPNLYPLFKAQSASNNSAINGDAVNSNVASVANNYPKFSGDQHHSEVTHFSSSRPEQALISYPLSESLSHAKFLSSKALQAVNHLLSLQQAISMPADTQHINKVEAEFGVSSVDLLDLIKKLQREVFNNPQRLDDGLRTSIETYLEVDSHRLLTAQQLLSLSVSEKILIALKENSEFDPKLYEYLNPLALLLFKGLLLDDALLRDENHPVRQVVNGIAFLGCRVRTNVQAVVELVQQFINTLLLEFDRDFDVFLAIIPKIESTKSELLFFYLRNLQKIQARYDGLYKIENARKITMLAVEKILLGKPVAPLLLEILEADYYEALCLAHVKQGENSKFWKIGLLAIEDLAVITGTHNANWSLLNLEPNNLFRVVQAAINNFPNKTEEKEILLERLQLVLTTRQVVSEAELIKFNRVQQNEESLDDLELLQSKWSDRVRNLNVSDGLRIRYFDKPEAIVYCAWIAPDKSRYVLVDHAGVVIEDCSLIKIIERFSKRQLRVLGSVDMTVFDQGLDSLIEKTYNELTDSTVRDELTGLLNRKGFEKEVSICLRNIQDDSAEHVLAYFSLDQFSIVNASGGYDAGDQYLKYIAQQLIENSGENVTIARLGGTEFGVLLKHFDEKSALRFMEDLYETTQSLKFEWENKSYQVNINIGIVPLHAGYIDVRKVLQDSQSAASIAKEQGGRHIHIFVDNSNEISNLEHISSWVTKIDAIIASDALRLRIHKIEPIKENDASDAKPHYEVLLSVLDGDQFLPPFEFIRAAERYNRMAKIDCWVIKTVFEWLIDHQQEQSEIGMLSVNLSGHSLNDGQLMKYIFEALASSKIACEKICFEITETVALTNLDDIVDFMMELKNLGCLFALDDFGTGSASYQYLKHLPVDFIKIDGSFVRDMTHNRHDWAMVKSITDMGHLMGISVIAEYVEDAETLEQLRVIGVDYAQGYYIEKPKWL